MCLYPTVSDPLELIFPKLFVISEVQVFKLLWHILSLPNQAKKPQAPEPTIWSILSALPTSTTDMRSSSLELCNPLKTHVLIALEIKRSWYTKIKVVHASKDNRSLLRYKGFQHMCMLILSEHISIVISHSKWLNFPLIHLICIMNEYAKEQ